VELILELEEVRCATECQPMYIHGHQFVWVPSTGDCPLTMEVMRDPVITADGQTYERAEIESWFALGKRTSPLTGAELPAHKSPAPNIPRWTCPHNIFGGQVESQEEASCLRNKQVELKKEITSVADASTEALGTTIRAEIQKIDQKFQSTQVKLKKDLDAKTDLSINWVFAAIEKDVQPKIAGLQTDKDSMHDGGNCLDQHLVLESVPHIATEPRLTSLQIA
jgi:hypothetical protein